MADADAIVSLVQQVLPEARVHPTDLTGGGDHWHCVVVDASFDGLRPLARQRIILDAFAPHIASGVVHALDLKCLTPDELATRHGGVVPAPFRPHGPGEGQHPGAW